MALLLSWDECLQNCDYPQRFFCPQPHTTSKRTRGVNSWAHSSTCLLRRRGNYQQQDQPWYTHSSLMIRKRLSLGRLLTPCMGLVILLLLGGALPSLSGFPPLSSSNIQQLHCQLWQQYFLRPVNINILCNIQARSGPLSKQPSKWAG